MEAVVAVAMTGGTTMEAMAVEDMTGEMALTPGVVVAAMAITQETTMTTMEAEGEDMAGTTMVDTMIMRTGSSSRGTMEEEEEEEFGMILHSIKAEEVVVAAGMEAMEVV